MTHLLSHVSMSRHVINHPSGDLANFRHVRANSDYRDLVHLAPISVPSLVYLNLCVSLILC